MTQPSVVAIVGPTASGKTDLSIRLACEMGGEIISMDSRQVYRGMDIGTAKATPDQRARAPHHALDLVEPDERFSAGRYARLARELIGTIAARGARPMLVGGTGFFLRALTHPIFREPSHDPARRESLGRFLQEMDDRNLHRWLASLDPETAARLASWGGRQRLMRALEMPLLTGYPLSWWHRHAPADDPPLRPLVFVLDPERERLMEAIDRRVSTMVDDGLLEEVEGLLQRGYDERSPGMNATGYIELIPFFRDQRTLEEALDLIRRNTRAYARRQVTWFRNQLPDGAVWVRPEEALETIRARLDVAASGRG
jgi:tRNA dimethylallyltransferase